MSDSKKQLPPTAHLMVGLGSEKATSPILKMAFCVKAYDNVSKNVIPELVNAVAKTTAKENAKKSSEDSIKCKPEGDITDVRKEPPTASPEDNPKVLATPPTAEDRTKRTGKTFNRVKKRN